MSLHILKHSLARVWVAELRDVKTQPPRFRDLCNRLTSLLFLEACRDVAVKDCEVQTPLEVCEGAVLESGVIIVPVLRAGLGMVEPILEILPEAQVGHVGVERDHETALPRAYYAKLPKIENQRIWIVDPMLATGGSLLYTIEKLRAAGARQMEVLCIIAAPEGVQALAENEPDVRVHTAALDRCLNDLKYILPGVGDFGDRLMGT